jgi:serine/threonine protein kinase
MDKSIINTKETTKTTNDKQIATGHDENSILEEIKLFEKKSTLIIERPHIASGGFSRVYSASSGNRKLAVKLILFPIVPSEGSIDARERKSQEEKRGKIVHWAGNEVIVVMNLKHKNSIRCYGYYEMNNSKAIILEYAVNKDLNYLTRLFYSKKLFYMNELPIKAQYNDYISENFLRFFFKQIYDVLLYLRDHSLLHGDIKLENFLLGRNFAPKLADYALSTVLNVTDTGLFYMNTAGTGIYLPPEALDRKTKDIPSKDAFKIDYFALGVMIFKMLFNEFPLKVDRTVKVEHEPYKAELNKFNDNPEKYIKDRFPRGVSDKLIQLLKGLLSPSEKTRFDPEKMKENGWLFENRINIEECYEAHENDYLKMLLELQKMDYIPCLNKGIKREENDLASPRMRFKTININHDIQKKAPTTTFNLNRFKKKVRY